MDIRKRGRNEGGFNANGGHKKFKQEMDSSGVGSKSKPCTKFFSTAGCPFGESCHFLHYVPGGYNAVAQMMNLPPAVAPVSRNMAAPSPAANGSAQSSVKSRMCNKYNTAEGCKYGDKCHFAHGEWELGKPVAVSHDDPRAIGTIPGRMGGRMGMEVPPPGPAAASFGASATAKISVEASLAGAIIGKGGVNSKQICRQTGAKLSIREHETDPNLRNIEFEGSFEQIKQASAMVSELIATVGSAHASAKATGASGGHGQGHGHGHGHGQGHGHGHGHGRGQGHGPGHGPGSNTFKTKICENFNKGSCSFGQKCHFAHGAAELRKSVL